MNAEKLKQLEAQVRIGGKVIYAFSPHVLFLGPFWSTFDQVDLMKPVSMTVCLYVQLSILKSSFDLNKIWYAGRGR